MKKQPEDNQNAIETLLDSVRELLERHYSSASRLEDSTGKIKIAFAIVVENREAKVTIAYGLRYKATVERELADENQIKLNLVPGNGAA
jgi:sulfite reductase alpha subunit-like flavoprotein